MASRCWIFDTAAGRVVGEVIEQNHLSITLRHPKTLAIVGEALRYSGIPYAPVTYNLYFAGIRGAVRATGPYLDAYLSANGM